MLIFKNSGSYQLCELSRITDCRKWFDNKIVKASQDKEYLALNENDIKCSQHSKNAVNEINLETREKQHKY